MGEAKIKLTAEDNASKVIDHVAKKLGVFNKEGIAMGISFAIVSKAIQLVEQGVRFLVDSFIKGIHSALDFERNMVHVTNVLDDTTVSTNALSQSLKDMSSLYAVDMNVLATNIRSFARQGYSANDSLRMTSEATRFAKANMEDLDAVVDTLNTTMEVFDFGADDSTYILVELNKLLDETGLSMYNISSIFGSAAGKIRDSNYSLEDMVDIIYTLSKEGYKPTKIVRSILELLDDIKGKEINILPDEEVKGIDEKFENVKDTSASAVDELGRNWDNFWEGVAEGALIVGKTFTQKYKYGGGLNFAVPVTETSKISPLFENVKSSVFDWGEAQRTLTDELNKSNIAISLLEPQVADYLNELDRSRAAYQYAQDMHAATLEVRKQTDAIEQLRRIANRYSLEQQSNQLEILRIQYGASGRRGGVLTRGEQRRVREIEQMNMGLRIKEMEQQVQIGKIQTTGLQTAQDNLDALKRAHDEVIYAEELETLSKHIDDVYKLWSEMYQKLELEKARLLQTTQNQTSLTTAFNAAPSGRIGLDSPATRINVNTVINTQRVDENTIAQVFRRGINRGLIDSLGIPNYNSR